MTDPQLSEMVFVFASSELEAIVSGAKGAELTIPAAAWREAFFPASARPAERGSIVQQKAGFCPERKIAEALAVATDASDTSREQLEGWRQRRPQPMRWLRLVCR